MTININGTTGISGVDGSAGTPAIQGSDTNTGVSFGTNTIDLSTDGTSRLFIDSAGRLLVGTSSNSNNSTAVFQGNSGSSTGGSIVRLAAGTATPSDGSTLGTIGFTDSNHNHAGRIEVKRDGGTWTSNSSHPSRLDFSTTADGASTPTERMRITNAGKFKFTDSGSYINASSVSHEFRNASSNNIIRFSNTNTTPFGNIIEYENAAPNSTGQEFLVCQDNSASRFRFRSNGGLANFQANDVNLCDEREKKNIEPLDSTWSCLKNWDLKKFHYNEDADTDDKRYGVIAQQVAEHCPEVISDWVKQKAEDAVLDDDGNVVTPAKEEIVRMGVKEQQMYWMAIKALQEAQIRIETLEARLSVLEGGAN